MVLAARIIELEAVVEGLLKRVSSLETEVATLRLGGSQPSPSASASPSTGPDPSGPSPAARAASPPAHSQGGGVEAPAGRPVPVEATAGLDAKLRHYVVVVPNERGQAGIYRSYQSFANAVRDLSAYWSGRGRLPWAAGSEGQGFPTRREAEDHFRGVNGLGPEAPVPHWA